MKLSINLATRTYINRHALRSGILAAISALVVWMVAGGYLLAREASYLSDLQGKIAQLESQWTELRGNDGETVSSSRLERRWKEVAFINHLLERDSYRWTTLLDNLEAQAFSGVVVKSIKPDFKKGTLALNGYARELKHLRRFIDNLVAADVFKEIYLLQQSQEVVKDRDGRDKKAIAFELTLAQGT